MRKIFQKNLLLTLSILLLVMCTITSCKDSDEKFNDLALEKTEIVITVGDNPEIAITAGSGSYSVGSTAPSVATATLNGNALVINALTEGLTVVTVTDTKTHLQAMVTVTVEPKPSIYFAASNGESDFMIFISAAPEDQADIWIDLNNNGIKEEGEEVVVFDDFETYPGNPEMTIHGKVVDLAFNYVDIVTIDVSKNNYLRQLFGFYLKLAEIDLTKNTGLEELYLDGPRNTFTSLDLSKNTKLTYLNLSGNEYLESIDVSHNPELTEFSAIRTMLQSVNFGSISKLKKIDAFMNENLEPFSVTAFTELEFLRIAYNVKFTNFFDLSKNTKLETLVAGGIDLSGATLDMSKNTELTEIYFYSCNLSSTAFLNTIPNPQKITKIHLWDNNLTSLKVSQFTNLVELKFHINKIQDADMTALIESLPNRTGLELQGKVFVKDTGAWILDLWDENTASEEQIDAIKAKNWIPYDANSGGGDAPI